MALVAALHKHNQLVVWMHILTQDGEMSQELKAAEPTAHFIYLHDALAQLIKEVEPIGSFSLLVGTQTKVEAYTAQTKDPVQVLNQLIQEHGLTLGAALEKRGGWPALPVRWQVVPHGGTAWA